MAVIDYAQMTYPELRSVYLESVGMEDVATCERLLAVIAALDLIRPDEFEHAGERISPRELNSTRREALKRRGFLQATARLPVSLLPQDNLRG